MAAASAQIKAREEENLAKLTPSVRSGNELDIAFVKLWISFGRIFSHVSTNPLHGLIAVIATYCKN